MNCLYPLRLDMKKIAKPENRAVLPPFVEVPCGKCIKCLLSKQYEWQFRGYCELVSKGFGTFITLTYDDEHNPSRVSKRDCQLFIKRLRSYLNDYTGTFKNYVSEKGISYICTSEYGSEKMRPHYHLCIFGFDFFSFLADNYRSNHAKFHGFTVLNSGDCNAFNIISPIWSYGRCNVQALSTQNIRYTLKYLLKGRLRCGNYVSYNDMLEKSGFEPLFFLKSKGIGSDYFEEHKKEIQDNGGITVNGVFHTLPPY